MPLSFVCFSLPKATSAIQSSFEVIEDHKFSFSLALFQQYQHRIIVNWLIDGRYIASSCCHWHNIYFPLSLSFLATNYCHWITQGIGFFGEFVNRHWKKKKKWIVSPWRIPVRVFSSIFFPVLISRRACITRDRFFYEIWHLCTAHQLFSFYEDKL